MVLNGHRPPRPADLARNRPADCFTRSIVSVKVV
jgi:hypothetical protein